MKAQLSIFFIAMIAMISNVACTKSSSSDDGGGTAAVSSTLALQGGTVAPGGTINLIPTGGVPPYSFTANSTIGGTLASYTTYTTLTAGTMIGSLTVTVTDAANATASATVTVTGTSSALTVSPLTTTVAPGGSVTYLVSGGTQPYTYLATSGTFAGAIYTAPGAAGVATITISDSAGHTAQATVTIQGTAVTSGSCSGTYTLNVGVTYTMSIIQNSTGQIGGYITDGTGYAPISGTCTSAGIISFTDLYSGSAYSGSFFVNPGNNKTVMTGTYAYAGSTYGWFAVQQ